MCYSLSKKTLLGVFVLFIFTQTACNLFKLVKVEEAEKMTAEQVEAQALVTQSYYLTSEATKTLYNDNNPTKSFLLANYAWQYDQNPSAFTGLINAYYATIFEVEGQTYSTPFYRIFANIEDKFYTSAVSPNGKYLLYDSGKDVKLHDLEKSKIRTVNAHKTGTDIYSVRFSPNGEYFVSTSADFTAKVWSPEGKPIVELKGHDAPVSSLDFSSDGKYMLTSGWDGFLKVWDKKGKEVKSFKAGTNNDFLSTAYFSPNNIQVLSNDGVSVSLWNWNLNRPRAIFTISKPDNSILFTSAKFSPDGAFVFTTSTDGKVEIWDLRGQLLNVLYGHTAAVTDVNFSPNGAYAITASDDGTAKIWNQQGKEVLSLQGHKGALSSARFSTDGKVIYTTSHDGTARAWQWLANPVEEYGNGPEVLGTYVSPDERFVMTYERDKHLRVWQWDGVLAGVFDGYDNVQNYAYYNPNHIYMVSKEANYLTRVWDSKKRDIISHRGTSSWGVSTYFSPNEQYILTADQFGKLVLWDWQGRRVGEIQAHKSWIKDARFSVDNQLIITASDDKTAHIWDWANKAKQTLKGHTKSVSAITFSPENDYMVTASKDGTAIVWGDTTARPLLTIEPVIGALTSVAVAPNGTSIALASESGQVAVWDIGGNKLFTLQATKGKAIDRLQFSLDGTYLLTTAKGTNPKRWLVAPDELITQFAQLDIADLSEEEKALYEVN